MQRANRTYNETSSLRPTTQQGLGSEGDLYQARSYMAHIIGNREAPGPVGIVAPNKLTPKEAHAVRACPPARAAYQDSLHAAQEAARSPDPTHGAKNYYLDFGQSPPPWAVGKKPIASFGPFVNVANGDGVHSRKKGDKVYVRVYHLKY